MSAITSYVGKYFFRIKKKIVILTFWKPIFQWHLQKVTTHAQLWSRRVLEEKIDLLNKNRTQDIIRQRLPTSQDDNTFPLFQRHA